MLIISRKKEQKIVVADVIEITILEVGRNRVRFGIKAPKEVPIQTRLKALPPAESPVQAVAEPPGQKASAQTVSAAAGLSVPV